MLAFRLQKTKYIVKLLTSTHSVGEINKKLTYRRHLLNFLMLISTLVDCSVVVDLCLLENGEALRKILNITLKYNMINYTTLQATRSMLHVF